MKRLIINADDLGMAPGVNRGIVEAHRAGAVSSSTLMVNCAAAEEAVNLVQREAPNLGLGLHLNLTFGRPLLRPSEVPSLVRRNGDFVRLSRGLSLMHHWRRGDVRRELTAQLERFTELLGRLPTHLDSHQFIGSLSAECREVMLDLAEAHNLPVRRGGRALYAQFERDFASWGQVQKTLAPSLFRRYPLRRHRHIFARSVRSPDSFDYRFHAKNATAEQLLSIFATLPEGVTELVCHPGHADAGADGYPYREAELAALTDPRVRAGLAAGLAAAEVEVCTFAALSPGSAELLRPQ